MTKFIFKVGNRAKPKNRALASASMTPARGKGRDMPARTETGARFFGLALYPTLKIDFVMKFLTDFHFFLKVHLFCQEKTMEVVSMASSERVRLCIVPECKKRCFLTAINISIRASSYRYHSFEMIIRISISVADY